MAISMKSMNNEAVKGLKLNEMFRNAVNNELYKTTMIINKVIFDKDGELVESYLGTTGDSPLVRAFGLSNKEINNVLVNNKTGEPGRRIKIDGQQYILSENIISIECTNKDKIEDLANNGYDFENKELGIKGHYIAVNASPSNEKHGVKYYARITEEMTDEKTALKIVDKIAGGVFEYLFSTPIDGKTLTKANTRFGNYASTMKSLAQIDLNKDYIMIVNKIKGVQEGSIVGAYDFDETTRKAMEAQGIEIDNHINDGANYFAPELIVEMAEKLNVKRYDTKAALQTALQVRTTHVTGKTMCRVLEQKDLLKMAQFNNATAYGNTNGRLLAVFDTDGAKLINYAALENGTALIDVYVMAVAHASTPNSSTQHLIKYMAINKEETVAYMRKAAKQYVEQYFLDKVMGDENANTTMEKIMKHLSFEEIIRDLELGESVINTVFSYAESMMRKNKIKLEGVYSHMMFDASYALTNGHVNNVLGTTKDGFVEAYSADVNRKYAKEIKEIEDNNNLTEEEKDAQLFDLLSGVVVKYPSAMPKEYEIVVYLTNRQMNNKLKAMNMDNEDRRTLQRYFNNTPWGCTVYAPINAMKNKLAGADCDFDATMCDMSELKHILIKARREAEEGFMGDCTFISYKAR